MRIDAHPWFARSKCRKPKEMLGSRKVTPLDEQ
jgi:hypothetical protein